MHPLWHLIPAALCGGITAFIGWRSLADIRAKVLDKNPWFRAALGLFMVLITLATAISATPIIIWILGAPS
jgi:hypothetical protein